MQVILVQDVERVGHEGDILTVADGYARNYLLPRGLAVKADRGALRDLENRRHAIEKRAAEKRAVAEQAAAELSSKLITVTATAGQGTRLHGTVTAAQIAEAAAAQLGLEIDRRDIDIAEPIRELGDYLISAKLYKDVAAQLPVKVVREGGEEEPEAPVAEAAAAPAEMQEEAPAEAAEEAPETTEETEA